MKGRGGKWRTALFALIYLAVIIIAFIAEEDFRGAYAWRQYKHQMEAQGERFDVARLMPPKVPDNQNFGALSIFTEPDKIHIHLPRVSFTTPRDGWRGGRAADLMDWVSEFQQANPASAPHKVLNPARAASVVLENLKIYDPIFAELRSASNRPYGQFIEYQDLDENGIKRMVKLMDLGQLLDLHADAEMVAGRSDRAIEDVRIMFRIDDVLKDEPTVISQLERMGFLQCAFEPVAEGLAEHRWTEGQRAELEASLQRIDLLESTHRAFYGERDICVNQRYDERKGYRCEMGLYPRGWERLDQVNINRLFQQNVFPRIDWKERIIDPSASRAMDLELTNMAKASILRRIFLHTLFAQLTVLSCTSLPRDVALVQSEVDMTMLACAIERYHLATGHCPENLNELVPKFVSAVSHDIIDGQPLRYRRTGDARFILYSIGWNQKDDGGVAATDKDHLNGDWVWQYPAGH